MIFCSCQLCICCVYMKCRESSWRKQLQDQQQHPNGVVENTTVDERDVLISPTQSPPPTYSVVINRDAPNDARIEHSGFQ